MNDKPKDWLPDYYFIGPSKTGTTWMYRSLSEHPEVFVPERDNMRFLDQDRWKGMEFYKSFFDQEEARKKLIIEFSPTYFVTPGIAREIHSLNPEAQIVTCLRNPIDRAYSHYWHSRAIDQVNCEFEEIFDYMNLYKDFIEVGFYELYLKPYFEQFPDQQINVLFFDHLKNDNEHFFQSLCEMLGIDSSIPPPYAGQKMNPARPEGFIRKKLWRWAKWFSGALPSKLGDAMHSCQKFIDHQTTYHKKGLSPEMRDHLRTVYSSTFNELPKLIGKEIPDWK